MITPKQLGKLGENVAIKFLQQKGYTVVAHNYAKRCGEIDIVATKDEYIVFVEVKTRRSKTFGTALEAVTMEKAKKIIVTSVVYMYERPTDLQPRFDIIEVYANGDNRYKVNHYENAFSMEDAYEPF